MKKLTAVFLLIAFAMSMYAQKITTDKVPPAVSASFRIKFPSSQQQTWSMEKKDVYEVVFFNGKKKQSATFESSGKWLETETEIQSGQLPKPVNQTLGKDFQGFSVEDVYELETPDKGTLYEVTVIKGRENYDVTFSAKGEVLAKEAGEAE
jgi:hypothetical protein